MPSKGQIKNYVDKQVKTIKYDYLAALTVHIEEEQSKFDPLDIDDIEEELKSKKNWSQKDNADDVEDFQEELDKQGDEEADTDGKVKAPAAKAAVELRPQMMECGICMEQFKDAEEVKVLDCGAKGETCHLFHGDCILQWFFKKLECPMCRANFQNKVDIRNQYEYDDQEEQKQMESEMDRFVATSNRINELLQSVHSLQVDINSLQQEAHESIARRRSHASGNLQYP